MVKDLLKIWCVTYSIVDGGRDDDLIQHGTWSDVLDESDQSPDTIAE